LLEPALRTSFNHDDLLPRQFEVWEEKLMLVSS
jgi:hypothetical protein